MTKNIDFVIVICTVLVIVFSCLTGWGFAHSTIAIECKKLGGFYVGDTVFQCSVAPEKGQQ